jgi:hypothetical protein
LFLKLATSNQPDTPLFFKSAQTPLLVITRCPTISTETKVGDVAYFVLVGIAKIGFAELFPADVQQKYKTQGAYAYHDYIEQTRKREELQSKLRQWYQKRQNAKI